MKTAKTLAAALADRLNLVVPQDVVVTAENGTVGPFVEGESFGGTDFSGWVGPGLRFERADGRAVLAALQAVQDGIIRALKSEWPGRGAGANEPGVEVLEDRLLSWYGDQSDPLVVLEPILLQDLERYSQASDR